MDIQQMWEEIDQRVDWLLAGAIALVVGNLLLGGYVVYFYFTEEEVLQKHGIAAVEQVEVDEDVLADLPELDEIEVEPPPEAEDLPERFVELKGTDLFLPLTARRLPDEMLAEIPEEDPDDPVDPDDPEAPDEPEPLPPITGFEITGRIIGDEEDVRIGILKRTEDNRMFIAREGEFLEGTEIRVKNITDTSISLAKPEHEETDFQFDKDRMTQQIREQILRH